jgi:hypothetical protein
MNGILKDMASSSDTVKDFLQKNMGKLAKLGFCLDEIDILSEIVTFFTKTLTEI